MSETTGHYHCVWCDGKLTVTINDGESTDVANHLARCLPYMNIQTELEIRKLKTHDASIPCWADCGCIIDDAHEQGVEYDFLTDELILAPDTASLTDADLKRQRKIGFYRASEKIPRRTMRPRHPETVVNGHWIDNHIDRERALDVNHSSENPEQLAMVDMSTGRGDSLIWQSLYKYTIDLPDRDVVNIETMSDKEANEQIERFRLVYGYEMSFEIVRAEPHASLYRNLLTGEYVDGELFRLNRERAERYEGSFKDIAPSPQCGRHSSTFRLSRSRKSWVCIDAVEGACKFTVGNLLTLIRQTTLTGSHKPKRGRRSKQYRERKARNRR